jgi:hypothetical protein
MDTNKTLKQIRDEALAQAEAEIEAMIDALPVSIRLKAREDIKGGTIPDTPQPRTLNRRNVSRKNRPRLELPNREPGASKKRKKAKSAADIIKEMER